MVQTAPLHLVLACLITLCGGILSHSAAAQTAATPIAPSKLPDSGAKAELVENPVTFRLVQLAIVETSLKLVDDAIIKSQGQANRDATKANNYQKNNELMDRKGGGPVAWEKFYGKTAEGFFYHPVDPNTRYVNPVPIAQRPPQLDYIYKANNDQIQKAKDDIAALGGRVDRLTDRKRQLETQQVALWGEISASLISQRDLSAQPLYCFQSNIHGMDTDQSLANRAKVIEAFGQFLRVLDKASNYVDQSISNNQKIALTSLQQNVAVARQNLLRDLASSISSDPVIREQAQPLSDLSKRLTQATVSAVETHDAASQADAAGDESQKLASRGLLQTAIIDFADKTALLDDGVVKLATDWNVKPDTNQPLPEVQLVSVAVSASREDNDVQAAKSIGVSSDTVKKKESGMSPNIADTSAQPKLFVNVVDEKGLPISDAEVTVVLDNGAYQDTKFEDGKFFCDAIQQPAHLFVAAPRREANIVPIPGTGPVTVRMRSTASSSAILHGRGQLSGIDGTVDPMLDHLNRTYMYAERIGFLVNGRPAPGQPLQFKVNQPIDAVSPQGKPFSICVRAIVGKVSILDYTLPNIADTSAQPKLFVNVVDEKGLPISDAEVTVVLDNGAYQDTKFEDGKFFCDAIQQPAHLFVAAPRREANIVPIPGTGPVTVRMRSTASSSAILHGRGQLSGIDGTVDPMLDHLNRTYMYADQIGFLVNGRPAPGKPLQFKVNQPIDAVSPQGKPFSICVRAIVGKVSILEYTIPK